MRWPFALPAVLLPSLLMTACPPPTPSTPGPRASTPPSDHADLQGDLSRLNERARGAATHETIAGMRVFDPYRALEQSSPLTEAWIAAQTEATRAALDPLRDPAVEERLRALLSIGMIGRIARGGERLFVTLREGAREQAALYRFEEGFPQTPLVDPLKTGPRAALDYAIPSPGGRYVAVGISENGDERALLTIVDAESGKRLPDRIEHAKWTSLAWLHGERGFYYTRYPRPGEARYDDEHEDSYFPSVFFHQLGTDPGSDPLVFQSDDGTDFPWPAIDEQDRYLVITNQRGWTASDVHLLDRGPSAQGRVVGPDPQHPLIPVTIGRDKLTSGVVHAGQLLLMTNEDAPRNRIVRVDLAHAADRTKWQDVVPESEGTIRDWEILKGHLAVHFVRDVRSELRVFSLHPDRMGEHVTDVPLPADGSIDTLSASAEHDTLDFTYSSFFVPPTIYRYRVGEPNVRMLYQVKHDLDTRDLVLSRARASSRDGTPVNIFYVHQKSLQRDGRAPVLLRGYGGFDISLLPTFTRTALFWIEQGGIYAVANLRGGGEFGEAWHRAGMLEQKHHVFEDFEAAVRHFSDSGLSSPARIAISGGSNGGLLVGAMITRSPELFGAAIAEVGLYDMLRYVHFPPAQLWVSEYGDPSDPDMAAYLHSYSPYHQVKPETPYPAALIETADHDTRVHWAHSTKFAARLQEHTSSRAPIHFYMERKMGHGNGTRLSDLVEKLARQQAFLRSALGL